MSLLYFEDFQIGDRTEVPESYPVTENEIVSFASKWDPQPFHIDREAAARSPFGGLTASGTHILAIRNCLLHRLPILADVIAALGLDEIRFHLPVRPGDELRLTTRTLDARPSGSKKDRGIVVEEHTLLNQKNEQVLTLRTSVLIRRRSEGSGT